MFPQPNAEIDSEPRDESASMLKPLSLEDMMTLAMPSEETLTRHTMAWMQDVKPCLIDHWPAELLALSMPTLFIDLPDSFVDIFEYDKFESAGAAVADQIDKACGWTSYFFRLNSRSPKDALWPFEAGISCSGKEIVKVMAQSERMLDDLVQFQRAVRLDPSMRPKLCLREHWPMLQPAFEYRVFVKDGNIQAVAEYFNQQQMRHSLERAQPMLVTPPAGFDTELRQAIESYFKEQIKPYLPTPSIVIDLFVEQHRFDKIKLIELNPYGKSDPVGALNYAAIEAGIADIARLPRHSAESVKADA